MSNLHTAIALELPRSVGKCRSKDIGLSGPIFGQDQSTAQPEGDSSNVLLLFLATPRDEAKQLQTAWVVCLAQPGRLMPPMTGGGAETSNQSLLEELVSSIGRACS